MRQKVGLALIIPAAQPARRIPDQSPEFVPFAFIVLYYCKVNCRSSKRLNQQFAGVRPARGLSLLALLLPLPAPRQLRRRALWRVLIELAGEHNISQVYALRRIGFFKNGGCRNGKTCWLLPLLAQLVPRGHQYRPFRPDGQHSDGQWRAGAGRDADFRAGDEQSADARGGGTGGGAGQEGASLFKAISNSGYFPPMTLQLIAEWRGQWPAGKECAGAGSGAAGARNRDADRRPAGDF